MVNSPERHFIATLKLRGGKKRNYHPSSMFLLGFIHSIIFCILGLLKVIPRAIIGHPVSQPVTTKPVTKKKNRRRKNKRPTTLELSSPCRPTSPSQEDKKMSYSTAHLGGRMMANTTIAEYKVSKDFHLEITEQYVMWTKTWGENHTQESRWSIAEFCQLVACAPGIVQFAEVNGMENANLICILL